MRTCRKLRYKFVIVLFGVMLALTGGEARVQAESASPQIALDYVPAYNTGHYIEGHIWFDGAARNCQDYAVTAYVQIENDGTYYGPKPYDGAPLIYPDADGRFDNLLFVSGGIDELALQIRVYLVPRDFVPDSSISRTKKASHCWAIVDRTESGAVTVRYSGQPPENEAAARAKAAPKPVPEPTQSIKHAGDTAKLSLAFSPYIGGLSPHNNDPLSLDEMKSMLARLKQYADTIRLFGVGGELHQIIAPAKQEFGLRIIAGAWIDGNMSEEQIIGELDTLIALANGGQIDVAVVGSETLHREDFSVAELMEYIQYVRSRIDNPQIPVTTSDTAAMWLSNSDALIEVCDTVLYTSYPYFSRIGAEKAVSFVSHQYGMMKLIAGGKPVIISEIGHPTEGSARGAAVPGMDQAKRVFESVYRWARENDVEVVWFEYIDEAYKLQNMDVEGHWGLFTADGEMKSGFRDLLGQISAHS